MKRKMFVMLMVILMMSSLALKVNGFSLVDLSLAPKELQVKPRMALSERSMMNMLIISVATNVVNQGINLGVNRY